MTEKEKKTCKKKFTKKTVKCIFKAIVFVLVFGAIICLLYKQLDTQKQQLELSQMQLRLDSQRVHRSCEMFAAEQMQAEKKRNKDMQEDELNGFAQQQYAFCIYRSGYDMLPQQNTDTESVEESTEGEKVDKPTAPEAENTETPE